MDTSPTIQLPASGPAGPSGDAHPPRGVADSNIYRAGLHSFPPTRTQEPQLVPQSATGTQKAENTTQLQQYYDGLLLKHHVSSEDMSSS